MAFVDADVRPPRDWLRLLTQRLHHFVAATGYRWCVPKRLTLANCIVASIDSSIVPIMFPGAHHIVWGGSWAIRRKQFESFGMREAWRGTLSDDLVAANVLARYRSEVSLEPACILPTALDMDMRAMFAFVRRQFMIGRYYSPLLWSAALAWNCAMQAFFWASVVAVPVGLATGASWTWRPAVAAAVIYGLHVARAWLRQRATQFYLPRMQDELTAFPAVRHRAGPRGRAGLLCGPGQLSLRAADRLEADRLHDALRRQDSRDRLAGPSPASLAAVRGRGAADGGLTRAGPTNQLVKEIWPMRVVLWDTRKLDVAKDFAGGMGVGQFPGHGGIMGRLIRRYYKRDRRPTALTFAYLVAIFRSLGHQVEYTLDRVPAGADLYVFNPSLITLPLERQAIVEALARSPGCRVLVVGATANSLAEAFDGLDVTICQGEPEQLLWKLDEVLACRERTVALGTVHELDLLPFPDWSLFGPRRFRIGYDFTKFPTALIQQSRGCTLKCNYCPYIILENATRLRSPESVAAEMLAGIQRHGFRSFKFRDPLFGVDRKRVFRLAELIGGLPRKSAVFDRRATRPAQARRARGVAGGGFDQHHRRHRDAIGRDPAALPAGPHSRRQAARFHPALPAAGHPHRGRLHDRLSRRH